MKQMQINILAACLLLSGWHGAQATQVIFGDEVAGTGWNSLGVVNGNSPQIATYTDSQSSPSGAIVFELTVNASASLRADTYLKVNGGTDNNRVDSNVWGDPADDEWVEFALSVSGPGAADLASLSMSGLTLNYANAQDTIDFSDGDGNTNTIFSPGSGPHDYTGINLAGLTPLSTNTMGSWSLRITARAFGTPVSDEKTTLFRISSIALDYQAEPSPKAPLPTTGLALHLDAGCIRDTADGAALSSWPDSSGYGRDAMAGMAPTYLADGGDGYPSVRFDGVDDVLETPLTTGPENTVFVVYASRRDPLLTEHRDVLLSSSQTSSNILLSSSRYVDQAVVVQFGWDETTLYNAAYQSQIGADEIIRWNGADSIGAATGGNGTLAKKDIGGALTSRTYGVALTTRLVDSSNPLRTNTVLSGKQLGINKPGSAANFQEADACKWSFDFDRDVTLRQLLFYGINGAADAMQVTIEGGATYNLTQDDTDDTTAWSSDAGLELYTFASPVALTAGTDISIEAVGSSNSANNKFSMGAVIVSIPPSPPDFPGFVAEENAGVEVATYVNGRSTAHGGTDIFSERYYIGSGVYTQTPGSTSFFVGGSHGKFGQNDIREILVYDYAMSDAERYEVLEHLGDKYSIEVINRDLDHAIEQYNLILSSQQIGDQYSHGEAGTYILDAARAMYRQGTRVFKLSLGDNYAQQSGVPINTNITSLKKLVMLEPSYHAVFDIPFTDILFWGSVFSVPNFMDVTVSNGLTAATQQLIYDEIYEFTEYLLQTYSGSGKRFYLGNWEGDWKLAGSYKGDPNTIPQDRIEAMIDWANIRQKAIDDAKANTTHNDVEVWYYLEMNKADWMTNGLPCIVNSVLPSMPALDFISFSSYSVAQDSESQVHNVLDQIHSALPSHPTLTGNRLIIGEYGYVKGYDTFLEQTQKHIHKFKQYLTWSNGPPRFVLQWAFFFNNPGDENPNNLKYIQQIGEGKELRPLYYMHENFYRDMRRWVEKYYEDYGTIPTTTLYAAEAANRISSINLIEYTPDLSFLWPGQITVGGTNFVEIPPVSTNAGYTATVQTACCRIIDNEPLTWSIAPTGQGVTIDTNGIVTVQSSATTGIYTVAAVSTRDTSVTGTVNVAVGLATGYEAWRADNFSGADLTNDAISGPLADPNNSDIPNLLRYALGMTINDVNPARIQIQHESGEPHFSFPYDPTKNDLTWIVEGTGNLTNWPPTIIFDSASDVATPTNGWTTLVFTNRPVVSDTEYFRLKIILNP